MIQLSDEMGAALCNRVLHLAVMTPRAIAPTKMDIDYNNHIHFSRSVLRAILPQLPPEVCSKIDRNDPRWSS
jgi:hypothetical protein